MVHKYKAEYQDNHAYHKSVIKKVHLNNHLNETSQSNNNRWVKHYMKY